MRCAVVLWLALAAPIAGAAGLVLDRSDRAAVQTCAAALAPGEEDREADLAGTCPRVAVLLADPDVARALGMGRDAPTEGQLLDLARLLEGFERTPEVDPAAALDHAGLEAMLAEVLLDPDEDAGWWERFKQWLLEGSGSDDERVVAFARWLEDLFGAFDVPEWFADVLFQGTLALVLVLAALVIANEVRAARLGGGWRSRRRRDQEAARGDSDSMQRDDGPALPGGEAAACLRATIERLERSGALEAPSRGRSNEEIARSVRRHDDRLAALFASLAQGVDQVVFGGARGEQPRLNTLARRIVDHLEQTVEARA